VYDVEEKGIYDHGSGLEDVEEPLVVGDGTAEVRVAGRGVHGEGFNGAKDAAQEDQARGAIQHDADNLHVLGQHARLVAAVVDQPHEGHEGHHHHHHHHPLQHKRNGNQHPPNHVTRGARICARESSADTGQGLDADAEVEEEEENAARVPRGMHGQVMHEAPENVIFGRGVDGQSTEDQDDLRDIQSHIHKVVGGDGAKNLAGHEDGAALGYEEYDMLEAVAAAMIELATACVMSSNSGRWGGGRYKFWNTWMAKEVPTMQAKTIGRTWLGKCCRLAR
jgi:hypothetical protein